MQQYEDSSRSAVLVALLLAPRLSISGHVYVLVSPAGFSVGLLLANSAKLLLKLGSEACLQSYTLSNVS